MRDQVRLRTRRPVATTSLRDCGKLRGIGMSLVLLLATVASPAGAADATPCWPALRGPRHDAQVANADIVDAFPPAGPPVLWTRPLGAGYSGFVADERRVYTQYQTLGGQFVLCLDAATGSTIWEHRYEGPYDPAGLYPGPRATPTLGEGRLFFSAPSGLVGCLESDTGTPIWSLNVFQTFGVPPVEFGYSCGPTLTDGKLLLPVGGPGASVVALEPATGAVLWKNGDDAISHVPVLPITFQGRRLAVAYLRNVLAAFDIATGEVVWRMPLSTGYDEHAAWPIYREPYLWIAAPFQAGSELLELTAESPGYRSVWKQKVLSNDVCSSVLADGFLYGFDIRDVQAKPHRPSRGAFRCVNFMTGEVQWSNGSPDERRRISDEGTGTSIGQASGLVADGKLVLFNELGELILARVNPERYEELGRVRVLGGEIGWTQPTLCDGRLVVRNHSRAACLWLGRQPLPEPTADTPRLTVADIPQSPYRDWAALLLPVEPEYAMDAPTLTLMTHWYAVSLGAWLIAGLVAGGAILVMSFTRLNKLTAMEPNRTNTFRHLHWLLMAGFGLAGTTLLGLWWEQFVFTWPLGLFAVFEWTVSRSSPRASPGDSAVRTTSAIAGDYVVLALFATVCVLYFLLCRRLSLAFEWVFLTGFPAALPFALLARQQSRRGRFAVAGALLASGLAFSAYYWAGVGFMLWRYPTL